MDWTHDRSERILRFPHMPCWSPESRVMFMLEAYCWRANATYLLPRNNRRQNANRQLRSFKTVGQFLPDLELRKRSERRVIFYIVAPLDLFHCSKYSSSLDCYRFVFESPKEFVRERIVIPRQKELSADGGFSEGELLRPAELCGGVWSWKP